jgi:hypothetical protein
MRRKGEAREIVGPSQDWTRRHTTTMVDVKSVGMGCCVAPDQPNLCEKVNQRKGEPELRGTSFLSFLLLSIAFLMIFLRRHLPKISQ